MTGPEEPVAQPMPVDRLLAVLAEGQAAGFLGPQPIRAQVAHARRFLVPGSGAPGRALDLGAGGGLPGLCLALEPAWAATRWVLLDASEQRCSFLRRAVAGLDLGGRVEVAHARAEVAAHEPALRSGFGLVVARSFGPPPVTAECGAGFLGEGAHLVVSEPPERGGTRRWPPEGLGRLGLAPLDAPEEGVAVLRRVGPVTDRYPRRWPAITRRPLWTGFT